jgi:hypothetical protein
LWERALSLTRKQQCETDCPGLWAYTAH